ncbi:MAG: VOC family protein [Bacteroidetes bacterium]|nr:VOC family protein [Bacteroidota bacterium]MBI3481767.1 VOC family protein [Bacteroidota bacterium]
MKNASISSTYFAPQLTLKIVLPAMEFYKKAFGATELRRWSNPDGSVHVAEMEIDGAMFHLHEENSKSKQLSPETLNGATSLIGIFVADPHQAVKMAEAAGGRVTNPVQDYDYGYRQGVVIDPFGHQWMIQKKI